MDTLNILERNILGALLDGDVKELAVLRAQADTVSVVRREMTGVGFFTTLSVSPDSQRLALGGRAIHDVSAEIAGLTYGVGFVLFLQGGRLDVLEGFTYGETYPSEATLLRWYYTRQQGTSGALVETTTRDLGRVEAWLLGSP